MKNLFSRLPKKFLGFAVAVVTVAGLAAAAQAWYPNRPTFTMQDPAPYVTFNSITDNPNYGDERTFFDGKDAANTSTGGFVDKVNVTEGQEVLLRVYVHNDASTNLNGTNFDGPGVAHDSKVRIALPTATDNALRANAYVSASNADPLEVSDTVDFLGTSAFKLEYVPGSAVMYTNAVPAGFKLSDSIVTGGAAVGYTGANGTIPGCLEYSGIVTVKVKVTAASFTVEKKVAKEGDTSLSKSVTTTPGATVTYQIGFTNTGTQTLNDVVIRDQMPKGVTLVPGSVKLYNDNYKTTGTPLVDDGVTSNGGQNIGTYTKNSNAFVRFKATMPAAKDLQCGTNKLTNIGEARANGTAMTDTADVIVNKDCQNQQNPTYSCNAFDFTVGPNRTITVNKFETTAKDGATFKNAVISWGDSSSDLTTNNVVNQTHTYAKDGQYTVKATAHFTVNGQDVTDATGCSKAVTFTTPTTPSELPHTGASSTIGLFGAIVVVATLGHRLVLSRRQTR